GVRQSVATVGKMDTKSIKAAMRAGQVDAWFIHLAEGTDAKSRAEFDALKADTLLNDMVVAIHCAGLTREQFRQMAAAGARVVWSPTSNLLLYGATADVPAALAEGCLVCLGADWSPSGCKNLLGELKMADQVDRRRFGDVISDTLLVKMVTSNPAFACGWDDCVGRLKPGYYADVAVFGRVNADPYRSLIDCTERDVRLVLVAGEPLYGDTALMGRLKPGDFEVLDAGGIAKGLDITRPGLAGADQSFADLRGVLQEAMEFDYEQMYEAFGNGRSDEEFRSFLSSELRQGYEPQRLDPLFPFGDTCFYNSLNRSANAAFGFDVRGLWEPAEQPVPDEWAAVLAFVNSARATARTLDFGVGLDPRAAANVVRLRDGADGRFGTGDDDRFETVAELDAVPYVGNTALAKLKAYVESLDADAKLLAFLNSAGTTAALLDDQVGLETRAARNIVAHRDGPDGQPGTADDDRFDDVAELLSVSYVGPTALSRLRQYAGDH
ncbi:amidohydrolase family protein, partial [candidate division WOR-3 bacterium]|nr:amidohydrolase family protein [candidate division WOR-3 bacterium]